MQYVLGLSFLYKKFKTNAKIRVFSNGLMLEELILEKEIGLTEKKKHDCRLPHSFPNKLFLIEVNGDVLGDSIDIECENHDNNYTNGFMSKFSFVKFHSVFMFPKQVLDKDTHDRIFERGDDMRTFTSVPESKTVWPVAVDMTEIKNNGKPMDLGEYGLYGLELGGSVVIKLPLIKKHNTIMFGVKEKAHGKFLIQTEAQNLIYHFDLLNTYNENNRSNI